jgi:hypothetical protein
MIRRRVDEMTEARLKQISWWNWNPEQLRAAMPDFRNLDAAIFARKYADIDPASLRSA